MTAPVSSANPLGRIDTQTGASGGRVPAQVKMARLFDRMDTAGTGSINRAQFDVAFETLRPPRDFRQKGADAIWNSLTSGAARGSVSRPDFITGMLTLMRAMRAGGS